MTDDLKRSPSSPPSTPKSVVETPPKPSPFNFTPPSTTQSASNTSPLVIFGKKSQSPSVSSNGSSTPFKFNATKSPFTTPTSTKSANPSPGKPFDFSSTPSTTTSTSTTPSKSPIEQKTSPFYFSPNNVATSSSPISPFKLPTGKKAAAMSPFKKVDPIASGLLANAKNAIGAKNVPLTTDFDNMTVNANGVAMSVKKEPLFPPNLISNRTRDSNGGLVFKGLPQAPAKPAFPLAKIPFAAPAKPAQPRPPTPPAPVDSSKAYLSGMPTEVVFKILSYVPYSHRMRIVPETCKDLHAIVKDPTLPRPFEIFSINHDSSGTIDDEETLVRISVANSQGHVVMDAIVKPDPLCDESGDTVSGVTSYIDDIRTDYHGVGAEDIVCGTPESQVMKQLENLIPPGSLLIGHQMDSLFEIIEWDFPKMYWRDLARWKVLNPSRTRKRNDIIYDHAGKRMASNPKDAAENAIAMMEVYKKFEVRWEKDIERRGWSACMLPLNRRPPIQCWNCGEYGHIARDCWESDEDSGSDWDGYCPKCDEWEGCDHVLGRW